MSDKFNPSTEDEKMVEVLSREIISDRTLRYKRNLFISSIASILFFIGKIGSNKIAFAGIKFELPDSNIIITFGLLFITLYYTFTFIRHIIGDVSLWKERIRAINPVYLERGYLKKTVRKDPPRNDQDVLIEGEHIVFKARDNLNVFVNMNPITLNKNIYIETDQKIEFFWGIEYTLPLAISFTALLGMVINIFLLV